MGNLAKTLYVGQSAYLYINGVQMATLRSCVANIDAKKIEVVFAGYGGSDYVPLYKSGTGSITIEEVADDWSNNAIDDFIDDIPVTISFIQYPQKRNPNGTTKKIVISDVLFDDFDLFNADVNNLNGLTLPFKFNPQTDVNIKTL